MLTRSLREIFRTNLGIQKNEKVLVFTDKPGKDEILSEHDQLRWERLKDIALLTEETGRGFTKNIVFSMFSSRKGHGIEPPASLWKLAFGEKACLELRGARLLAPLIGKKASEKKIAEAETIIGTHRKRAVDAVIALSNYSTSHTCFRDFLTRICGARYASMPLFDIDMFEGAMNVDWKELEKRTMKLSAVVNKTEHVELSTPNGTRFSLSMKGRKAHADTGMLRKPGDFGNLPAGEVFFAPLEGTARGRLVLDWAPTRRLDRPVTLSVIEGMVCDIEGDDPFADILKAKLDEKDENRNIAEFGIGTNDRASRPDNILESEKIFGTIHIALGDNSSFGGRVKTPFHQDFVFFKPSVILIDRNGGKTQLMRTGKMVIEGM